MSNKLHGKDLKAYQDVDLDDLLSKLTDAELEELHTELIDPDVSFKFVQQYVRVHERLRIIYFT
jgi:Tropomodulin